MWETTTKRAAEPLEDYERSTKAMRTTFAAEETSGGGGGTTTTTAMTTMVVTIPSEKNRCHGTQQESHEERQRRRQIWLALQHRWNQWFVAPALLGLDERRHGFQRCLAQMDRIMMNQDSIGQSAVATNEWWLFHQQFATLPRYQQIAFRELVSHAFFRNGGLLTDAAVQRWVSM